MKPHTLILPMVLLAWPAAAQPVPGAANSNAAAERKKILDNTRSHFTKYDYRIPMRDGVKLFTSVYVPKDRSQTYPFLIERTPYSIGPYGADNYRSPLQSEAYEKEGFIFVYQDVRGRYLSEGTFIDVPPHKLSYQSSTDADDASDTYDTIDWLLKNVPANNGKAGIKGISYNGFYAAYGMINSHPALKAASPQAPMGDVGNGDDSYHNGAFYLAANFGFYTGFKPRGPDPERPQQRIGFEFGTPDQYDFYLRMGPLENSNSKRYLKNENEYWTDLLKHPNYDDYWASRALAPHVRGTGAAALWVGGWFDAEDLSGPLKLFRSVEAGGPKVPNTLVMGPWNHGGWSRGEGATLGNLDFRSKTGEYFREQIELPFFVFHLKGKGKPETFPKAWVFETGTNQWVKHDAWPPKGASEKKLYFHANGSLSFDPGKSAANAYDEYTSDPAHPVPVLGFAGPGMPGDYMTVDQRFAAARTDVLTYETAPLETDVTIAGPITPSLRVSTSGTDSDFVVKLIDVYPGDYPDPDPNPARVHMGGYQQLLRGEPFRGKFRKSFAKPEPFTPGKPETIEYVMPDVCHTFRPGHRIMVQIQSSWFPLTDRNPQTFVDIPKAKASDFQKAVERVFRGGDSGLGSEGVGGTIDSFASNGYAIFENVFTAAECDAVSASFPDLSPTPYGPPTRFRAPTVREGSPKNSRAGTRHLLSNSSVNALANDDRLLTLARQAAASPAAIPFRATLFNKTSKANWLIPWHQDTALPVAHRFDDPQWGPWSEKGGIWCAHAPEWALRRIVALRIHLDASTHENGPLRVIPGTHEVLLSDQEVEEQSRQRGNTAVECLSPSGGVIAMRPLVIHASSKIANDLPRRVLHIEYAASLTLRDGIELRVA